MPWYIADASAAGTGAPSCPTRMLPKEGASYRVVYGLLSTSTWKKNIAPVGLAAPSGTVMLTGFVFRASMTRVVSLVSANFGCSSTDRPSPVKNIPWRA
ncbi:hypothetical protein ACRJ4B_18900 [Streptomyces sp. GTA36]